MCAQVKRNQAQRQYLYFCTSTDIYIDRHIYRYIYTGKAEPGAVLAAANNTLVCVLRLLHSRLYRNALLLLYYRFTAALLLLHSRICVLR